VCCRSRRPVGSLSGGPGRTGPRSPARRRLFRGTRRSPSAAGRHAARRRASFRPRTGPDQLVAGFSRGQRSSPRNRGSPRARERVLQRRTGLHARFEFGDERGAADPREGDLRLQLVAGDRPVAVEAVGDRVADGFFFRFALGDAAETVEVVGLDSSARLMAAPRAAGQGSHDREQPQGCLTVGYGGCVQRDLRSSRTAWSAAQFLFGGMERRPIPFSSSLLVFLSAGALRGCAWGKSG